MRGIELGQLRSRGARQGIIKQHRGLRRLARLPRDVVSAVLLSVAATLAWLAALPAVTALWRTMFEMANRELGLGGVVGTSGPAIPGWAGAMLPQVTVTTASPTLLAMSIALGASIALAAASMLFPARLLPLSYIVRAIAALELSAIIYFLTTDAPALPDVAQASLSAGTVIIGVIPALLGMTLYLFDPSLARNAAATVLLMGHLIILLPLQYLLQVALISQGSELLAPICFFTLGPTLDVMVLVAFYGWAMSRQPLIKAPGPAGAA